jgi:hypothetical protein
MTINPLENSFHPSISRSGYVGSRRKDEKGSRDPDWARGYRWDIVLRGRGATVFEPPERKERR